MFSYEFPFERTYDIHNNQISYSGVPTIESNFIEVKTNFLQSDKVISKFYNLIDAHTIECVTSEIDKDILSFELFTCVPPDSEEVNWSNIFSNLSWYCLLYDSDHNEIGNREVSIGSEYCCVETTRNKDTLSQTEYLRPFDKNLVDEYGSIFRYIEFLKVYYQEGPSKFSKGGILLATSFDAEYHKLQIQKLKSK